MLILHDPDAPLKDGFTHWLLYNIPPNVRSLNENTSKEDVPEIAEHRVQGRNSEGTLGYTGPCPPSGVQRYFARFYALRTMLALRPGADTKHVQRTMEHKIIQEAGLMGTYEKNLRRESRHSILVGHPIDP